MRLPFTAYGTSCGRAVTLGLLASWLIPALLACLSCPAAASTAGPGAERAMEFRALWVLRSALVSETRIDNMVRHAVADGFNTLFVQVRGRGDALYDSGIEPTSELLSDTGFDPLAYTVTRAHSVGLRVHVWLNAFLVWSAPLPPRSPEHVVLSHPDWVHVRADGRSMLELSRPEIEGMGAEGVFLSPGNPEVRERLRAVVREIVERYDVDGVHLDYVRLPSMDVGYDVGSRSEFMRRYGVDPFEMERAARSEERLYGDDGLRNLRSLWAGWRSASVTETVASIRSDMKEIKPSLALSAAVIADVTAATTRYGQDWPAWLKSGLLDFAVPMCYSASTWFVKDQVERIRDLVGGATFYPGLALYNQSPARVVDKVRTLRALGVGGFSFFCYDPDQPRDYTLRALGESVFSERSDPHGRSDNQETD